MKKMYVWERVSGLTSNWHDGGGTLVVADSLEFARELLQANGVSKSCEALTEEPNISTSVEINEDLVVIFPDAGCC